MLSSITRTEQKSKTLRNVLYITMPALGVAVYFIATALMQIHSINVLR